jgi:imidazolonepropionase-like amidohydrolase
VAQQVARLALLNGRLVDGTGRAPQDGWGLVVEGATIRSVGPPAALDVPRGATVVDVGGRTLMPGLIDAHTHLTYHRGEHALILQQLNETLEMNTLRAAENARLILETGCTAIGDGASRGNIAVAIRDAVHQGIIPGPKVVAAGQMLSGSGGIGDHTDTSGHHEHDTLLGTVVDGPQEVRAAVRRQIRRGVDWIKLTASGTPGNLWIGGRTPDLEDAEIRAAVEEAAKFGKPVHAHAHGAEAVTAAVRAGVISVHSAEFADDPALALMKERGCVFVPTIGWLHFRVNEDYAREYTRAYRLGTAEISRFVAECEQAYEACRETIVRAFAIGTPTAIGSDGAHVFPPFDIVREMEYFQELGIAPLEIIASATSVSARAVGRAEVWGTLAAGKAADVLVVDGDPTRDVRVLRDKARIVMIIQDGRILKDRLQEASCRTTR